MTDESDYYRGGYDVGYDVGAFATSSEAIRAYEAGEIDLWIETVRPKTIPEWEEFEKKYPDIHERWSKKKL